MNYLIPILLNSISVFLFGSSTMVQVPVARIADFLLEISIVSSSGSM